jgi:hypothetical protein
MRQVQFRVLFRHFLFRTVDLELLSAHAEGDTNKLLSQFAALLVFFSLWVSLGAFGLGGKVPRSVSLIKAWPIEHFLISTTMLIVGLFAVLSWDSMFPDRRDVLVLAPLPIRPSTVFLARIAALATALAVSVAVLNAFTGITYPLMLGAERGGIVGGIVGLLIGALRPFFAYWITMLAAGAFVLCSVLVLQGLAVQLLPRGPFLRVSAILQMAAFSLFISMYFLEPSFNTPAALTAEQNQETLAWFPSYWFLALFQTLNGSAHPALDPWSPRAFIALAITMGGAAAAFLLSYLRTLRKIVEEPDIIPAAHSRKWSPRLGNSLTTAIMWFTIRTLLRSRQHRVMLAFYLGIGFAAVILFTKTLVVQKKLLTDQAHASLMVSSVVMMSAWVVGTRVVFALPLALRANWIFQLTRVRSTQKYLAAVRSPLFALSVAPVWFASAAVFFSIWPWTLAASHLIVLALWGIILAWLALYGFHKIPFTCSWLPGKSSFHMVFLGALALFYFVLWGVIFEQQALKIAGDYLTMVFILCIAAVCAIGRTIVNGKSEDVALDFEQTATPEIFVLGLYRDGVLPIEQPTQL